MENAVTLQSGKLTLEGRYAPGDGTAGVVITHPHSLYGGDMENPVVAAVTRAYGRAGYATLRFNFRGVGRSTGFFDQGAGEAKDVAAALAFLSDRGVGTLHLAGYSFGAWVNARVDGAAAGVARMVMVSPPVAFMDYDDVPEMPRLHYVVTGSGDEIAPPALIREHLARWNPHARFEVIRGADHFYGIHLETLERMLYSAVTGG
jgi:hypothetical protein